MSQTEILPFGIQETTLMPRPAHLLLISLLLPAPVMAQNYALRFEGAQLEFPPHPILNTGDTFTAEAWIRAFAPTPDGFKIFDRYAASAEHKYLSVLSNGAVEYIYAGSPWPEVTSAPQLSLLNGSWHHVAFVRRPNGDHAAFLDGVQISGGGPGRCWSTCNVINASPSTWVGGREAGSFPSGWEVDAMRISTVDRYWGTFTPPTSLANDANCAMLLNFNEGAGSLAQDEGPAQQVGAVAGTYSWVNVNGPPHGPYLAHVGTCPGAVTLTITGASPSGLLAVLYGRPGSFTKLTPPCSGMVLGLAQPALAALIPADNQGSASLNFQAPVGACGRSVQCVDVLSCTTTNLIVL